MAASLFTKIIRGDIPGHKVAEGSSWFAFLDTTPRREGHTLVVPKEQQALLAQLSSASQAELLAGVVEVQRRLSAVFQTTAFSETPRSYNFAQAHRFF